MPLYEYKCGGCGASFDLIRSFSQADEPAVCPKCHASNSKRAISRFAAPILGGDGSTTSVAESGGGCAGCSSGNCASCHR